MNTTLANRLVANYQGATLKVSDAKFHDVDSGYYVGGAFPGISFAGETPETTMIAKVSEWLATIPSFVKYVGTWQDSTTGEIFVDATYYLTDRERAISVAKKLGERAIFDIYYAEEIRVD